MFSNDGSALKDSAGNSLPAGQGSGQDGSGQGSGDKNGQGSGGENFDWRQHIPEDYREAPGLKDVKDLPGLVKQFVDQQKFLGNSIRIPGEDGGPDARKSFVEKIASKVPELMFRPDPENEEAMEAFYLSAGIPKEASGYEVDEEVLKELNPDWLESTKAVARELGVPKGKFKKFVGDHVKMLKEQAAENAQAVQAEQESLRNEWGASTTARLNEVKKFAEVMGAPEGLQAALNENVARTDLVKFLWNVVTQFGGMQEGGEVKFQIGGSIPDSPADLKGQIEDIKAHPDYLNPRGMKHKDLVAKMINLQEKLDSSRR